MHFYEKKLDFLIKCQGRLALEVRKGNHLQP